MGLHIGNLKNFTKTFKNNNLLFASLIQCSNNVCYSRIILVLMRCKPSRIKKIISWVYLYIQFSGFDMEVNYHLFQF